MKIYIIVACLFFVLPTTIWAENKTDSASELYSIMLEQKLTDENFDQNWSFIETTMVKDSEISEEVRLKLDELKEKIWLRIKNEIQSDKFREEYINFFTEVFNEEELKALVDFYKTPVGKSILRKSSLLHDNISYAIGNSMRNEVANFSDDIADIIILLRHGEKDNHLLKADNYLEKKDYIKAIEEYEAGLEADGNNPNLLNNYAWALVSCPKELCYDPNKAIQLAQKALEIKKAAYILDTLAAAYAELGNYKKSAEILRDILNKKDEYCVKDKNIPHYEKCLNAYSNNTTCIDK